jgi:hypothetical protein
MQIASNYGQGDVALEAVDPMIATEIQSVRLQGVDGRFHGAVTAAQADELRIALALTLSRGALALFGHDRKRDDFGQSLLVGRAVKALVCLLTLVTSGKRAQVSLIRGMAI